MANFYKGSFVNTQVDYTDNSPNEQTFYVKITDVTEDDGSIIDLELADAPVVLQTVDNSEDKFTTIKSKSCTLRVFTSDEVNAMIFAGGGDTQYKVEIAVNSESDIIYTGWLSLSDLGQTFQPDPNVLTLTATDGIAFLKSVPMSDNEGRFLTGPHPLIKLIAWALQKTGLELDIWIQMNLLEVNSIYDYPDYHFYNTVFLNAQTFEADLGELEDSYTVLQKILGEFCELSQQKNVWFIKSIDEANYAQFRICRFDYEGTPSDYITELYAKDIGADSDFYTMAFMNDDARLSLQRPFKSVKNIFNFEYPTEIVQNIGMDRGDVIQEPDFTQPTSTGLYKPEGWTHFKAVVDPPQIDYVARIVKTYNYGYEQDSYLELSQPSPIGATLYVNNLRSTPVTVEAGDRLRISFEARTSASINYWNPLQVRLVPDTGSDVYDWQMDNRTLDSAGNPTTNQWNAINPAAFAWWTWTVNNNIGNITSSSAEIDIPYSGKLYVRLLNANYQVSTIYFSSDTWFTDLNIQLTPKINGSWARYTGQEHLSEQDINTEAERETEVFMTDAPRVEMKGAMLRTLLADTIYTGNAIFDDNGNVTINGFMTPYIAINDYIRITNTTNNNGKFRVVDISYSVTLNKTAIAFDEPTISEIDASTTIQSYRYELTENFYDSIDWPGGGAPQEDQIPYGQHQNQAVWNQFNRVFSAFEATIDGLDTDKVDNLGLPDLPDLMHMYRENDVHPATYNKQFKCLHYEQDTDNCEWSIYMIEVGDGSIPKTYNGHSFKYIQK